MNKSGVVAYIGNKNIKGQDLHSFTLKGVDGFFNCNTTNPNVNKGDFISFDAEQDDKGNYSVNVSSISRSSSSNVGRSNRTPVTTSKDQYWEDREKRDINTQKIIQLQASRNAAIALASAVLQAGAVPGYGKAKESEKSEVIMAYVDYLTEHFQDQVAQFKDSNTENVEVKQPPTAEVSGKWE